MCDLMCCKKTNY